MPLSKPWPKGISDSASLAPALLAGLAFFLLFQAPMFTLVRDWWQDSEAAHGLLLGPLAFWLAWKRGIHPSASRQVGLGLVILLGAVAFDEYQKSARLRQRTPSQSDETRNGFRSRLGLRKETR